MLGNGCSALFFISATVIVFTKSQSDNHTRSTTTSVPECIQKFPEKFILWQNNNSTVRLDWALNKIHSSSISNFSKDFCNTTLSCFGFLENITEDKHIGEQLRPLAIQDNGLVIFHFGKPTANHSIHVYQTTKEAFLNCSLEGATLLSTKEDEIQLNRTILKLGESYFIFDLGNGEMDCELGWKINITVKHNHCTSATSYWMCSNRGTCLTTKDQPNYICECCPGYEGQFCENHDPCLDKPCLNNGVCLQTKDSVGPTFQCQCIQGFYGDRCEKEINLCNTMHCQNNASCQGNRTTAICECLPGFSGITCEINIDDCASNPCIHGICIDQTDGHLCFCSPGYGGVHCEYEFDECSSNPCKHGGQCINKINGFECRCGPGYKGLHCEEKVNLCLKHTCPAESNCKDNGNTYLCECKPGYTGTKCEININDCASNPCKNGGVCQDKLNGYICRCPQNYFGMRCTEHRFVSHSSATSSPDGPIAGVPVSVHLYHLHNIYIAAGTLACAFLIVILVVTICHCRFHRTYEMFSFRMFKNSIDRRKENLKFAIDVSSVSAPRPSIDAIYEATSIDYQNDSLNAPLVCSLKPRVV